MQDNLEVQDFQESGNETKIFKFPINTGHVENTDRPAVYEQVFNIPDGYAIKDFRIEEISKVGEVKGPILNYYNAGSFLVSDEEILDQQQELFDFLGSLKETVPIEGVPVPVETELKIKIQDELESFSSRKNQYISSDNTIEINVEAHAVKDSLGIFYKSGGNYEGIGYLEIEPVEGTSEDLSALVEELKIEIQNTFENYQPPSEQSTVSFTTPASNNTDPGNPVDGVMENDENTIDGQVEWLFSNSDDPNATVPVGYTRVKGLSGHDNITGNSVGEWFNGNKGNDTINGAGGIDTIFGGEGSDNLNGDTEGDWIFGNKNNDDLTGGDGNDTIFGGEQDDIISGGAGDDVLFGDKGQDQLIGGDGNDIFALPGSAAAATTLNQADVIMDYGTGSDLLMLPDGVNQSQLTFSSVDLQIDSNSAEASTAIQLNGTFLAIVKGVTSQSEINFVPFDSSVVPSS
jgi:hypothetical protein